ncbi:hypothetical protein [Agromyces allii]|uniref:Gram-positive cocci surface proteins LPxTG domain-containing protein n=1 Tax=Agromyces allii TaxID=393607 RepID=A0ABP5BA44_9MICO|nr:hypothetical protein [Agromyces allii]
MKRTIPALVVAVLGAGLALAGTVAPASAATPTTANSVVASCDALTVDLSGYAVEPGADAVYQTVEVSPAVAEVSHTDYVYKPLFGKVEHVSHKDAGKVLVYDWTLYYFTGETRTHVEVAAQDAVTKEELVSAAIPADAEPNTVTVTVDGEPVAVETFGAAYTLTDFPLLKGEAGTEAYGTHTYSVSVTAYQGFGTEPVTSVVDSGSTECATGDFAAVATIDTVTTCGTAVVTLTNAELLASKINGTYSAIVSVDGKPTDFLAVFENSPVKVEHAFAKDSGAHVIGVRTGPAHGDTLLAQTTVLTDCIVKPTDPVDPVDPALDPKVAITGSLTPGGSITVTGTGFAADTEYEVELHSTPQSIASVTSGSDGSFSGTGSIDSDTPTGDHEIVVTDGEGSYRFPVTITAASTETPTDDGDDDGTDSGTDNGTGTSTPAGTGTTAATGTKAGLASTGFDTMPLAALAAALLTLAGIAFGARRAIRVKG